jgi:hypothetical protein
MITPEIDASAGEGVADSTAALSGPSSRGRAATLRLYRYWHLRRTGRLVLEPPGQIPLGGIPAKFIEAGMVLEARVPGTTGRDGGPNCATVKDFEGWKAVGR